MGKIVYKREREKEKESRPIYLWTKTEMAFKAQTPTFLNGNGSFTQRTVVSSIDSLDANASSPHHPITHAYSINSHTPTIHPTFQSWWSKYQIFYLNPIGDNVIN